MSDNILEPNINGLPPITDWQKVFLVLQQANEAFLRGATLPELGKQIIGDVQIQGSDFVDLPVAETTDPVALPIPSTGNKFGFLADGKFTQPTGGTLEYSSTQWGLTLFDGVKWVKKFTLDLPVPAAIGKVESGNNNAVSGEEVFNNTLVKGVYIDGNKYSSSNDIPSKYIQNSTGILVDSTSGYVVSGVMPAKDGDKVYLINWVRTASFCVRFIDSGGSPIKPLHSDGTEFSSYNETFLGHIVAPPDSVGVQLTVKFNGVGDQSALVVNNSGNLSEKIKPEYISANGEVKKDDESPISGNTANAVLVKKETIIDGENLYDYKTDIEGIYINTNNGSNASNATSAMSQPINVTDIDKVVIKNRTGNAGYRFLSESNTPMKALDVNGNQFATFGGVMNGEFYKPEGSVYFQFTTKFTGTTNRDKTIVNESGLLKPQFKSDLIPVDTDGKLSVDKSGVNFSVNGKLNDGTVITNNFITRSGADNLSNPNFNLISDMVNGVLFKDSFDDISPVNLYDNRYIGGNHGWSVSYNVTKSAHGKSFADVGSVYTDSNSNDFVIIRIISDSVITVCARNKATDGYSFDHPQPQGTLNYKSNGTNTGAITSFESARNLNLFNTVKLNSTRVVCDTKEVVADGSYWGQDISITEDYDVFELDSVLAQLIANRPSGGYSSNPNLNSFAANKLFNHSIVYQWKAPGKCTISHSFLAYRKLKFNFHSIIQCSALTSTSAKIYIPKSLPVGGVDYRLAGTYNAPASDVNIVQSAWEYPSNAPDRVLNFITGNYGIHVGYVKDLGSSVDRATLVNNAVRLATTKKIYPNAIDTNVVLESGSYYSIVAFRNIVDMRALGGVKTSIDMVEAGDSLYVLVDYHTPGMDEIEIPDKWLGKSITVIESRKASLLGNVSTKKMRINSTANDYGFIIIKIT